MTTSNRLAVGISAATVALGLALVSAAFADDPMSQDIDFRNSVGSHAGIKSSTVRETPPKDGTKDSRKKEDGLKSYGSSK